MKKLLFLIAALPLGCFSTVHATAMRVGPIAPALPSNCGVRFENLSFSDANAKYEQVGLVTLSGTSSEPQAWEGSTRKQLQPKACALGGTIVTPNGMADGESHLGMGTGMIQFAVWRERVATIQGPTG